MRTRIFLLLSSITLAAPCLHAEDVVDKPLGEPVEQHLSDYQPFRQWVHDPALFEKEAGDRLETRQVAAEDLETVKLAGLVAPIRFESGVADIPAGYVEKLETILDGMRGRRNVRLGVRPVRGGADPLRLQPMKNSFKTSRGTILIREANAADAVRFRELRLEALQNSPIAFSADYQKNFNQSQKYWEDLLTPQPDESTMFIAEHENRVIGMTGVMRSNSPKTRHAVWIWGVYVTPEWRGLHIAEELITSCLEWAKARMVALAKLGVAVVNEPAIRCYERCGFKTYGTEPRAVLYDGKYYDEHLMSIDLDTP